MLQEIPRIYEYGRLLDLISSEKYELMFVKGRRRVGKTFLLKKLEAEHLEVVYYFGQEKKREATQVKEFSFQLTKKTGLVFPEKISSWNEVFYFLPQLSDLFYQQKSKILTLIFDEVQWLGSSFVGILKGNEPNLIRSNNTKIILSGSSYKFFDQQENNALAPLRGMRTKGHLEIKPLIFNEVSKAFSKWSQEDQAFLYMVTGGIPYYLKQMTRLSIRSSVNEAMFTKSSIFLPEIDELLGMEFRKNKINNIKILLSFLVSQSGKTMQNLLEISKRTNIPRSTVVEITQDLYRLGYLSIIKPDDAIHGRRYKIFDFYLFAYFSIIKPNLKEILNNDHRDLFSLQTEESSLYINNFTGYAFENFIYYNFLNSFSLEDRLLSVYKKLDISRSIDPEKLFSYNNGNKENQIDIIYVEDTDNIIYVMECKSGNIDHLWIDEILAKKVEIKKKYKRQNVLFLMKTPSKEFKKKAEDQNIIIIEIQDFK